MALRNWSWKSHFAGALAAGLAVWIAWAFIEDATVPVIVYGQEIVETPVVKRGDELRVLYPLRRLRSCPATVHQWFFDARDQQYAIMPFEVEGRPLGLDRVELAIEIPVEAAAGPARYQLVVTHECNVLGFFTMTHREVRPYQRFAIGF